MSNLAVQTRFFERDYNNISTSLDKLKRVVVNILSLKKVGSLYVAINEDADVSNARDFLLDMVITNPHFVGKFFAYGVSPWGRFVSALNATLLLTPTLFTHLMFVSTEIILTDNVVSALVDECDAGTLVVGACLDGHIFCLGENDLNGVTSPWNTCAVWNLDKLRRLGFPLAGDALFDDTGKMAGNEEVVTVSLYQMLYPDCRAKLLNIPGIVWNTNDLSGKRLEWHKQKVSSRVIWSREQLAKSKIMAGTVLHK